jgi:CBS domain-containing protein
MKVKEVMSRDVTVCMLNDNLSVAAGLMWENDCGILPVVAEGEKVIGLITDRDICMAATLKNQRLSNIAVEDVISGDVYACKPDDDIRDALKSMQEHKVRRLAVVAKDGTLEGILSMNDVILKAEEGREKKPSELSYGDVVKTYKSICQHRLPLQAQAAGSV